MAIWLPGLLVLLVYTAGLPGDFFFDDAPALTGNPLVKVAPERFDDWRVASQASTSGPLGRPIAMLSFAANYALSGEFLPAYVKLWNILIHLCCGAALYAWLLAMLTGAKRFWPVGLDPRQAALLATAIWLLHPLHVSTVLYSVQRMAQLSTLFVFAGLALYCRYRVQWMRSGASADDVVAACLWLGLLLLSAMYSKENGVLLVWLLPLVEFTVFRGVWAGKRRWYLVWLSAAGMVLPVVAVVTALWLAPEWLTAGYEKREFTLHERLLTQSRVLWQYLGWLMWPAPHHMGFQHDYFIVSRSWLEPFTTSVSFLAWVSLSISCWLLRHRAPVLGFCLLFYLVGHSLESSVIPLEMVYEHRNYLPSASVCLLLAVALQFAVKRLSHRWRKVAPLVMCMLLGFPLFLRADAWENDFSLARTNALRHPDSARSRYFYANALLRQYRLAETLELGPEQARSFLMLGREELLAMLSMEPDSIPAIVMLHYIDSRFFPDLARDKRWDRRLIATLPGAVLAPEDMNALHLLMTCHGDGECLSLPGAPVRLFLDLLREYGLDESALIKLELAYLQSSKAPPETQVEKLESFLARSPGELRYYPLLVNQYAALHDAAGIYATVMRWMKQDGASLYLSQQKTVFGT